MYRGKGVHSSFFFQSRKLFIAGDHQERHGAELNATMTIDDENDPTEDLPPPTESQHLWLIENYYDEPKIILCDTELMQYVCIRNCERCIIDVKGMLTHMFS